MLDDDDPEKFERTGVTDMKHKILELYLSPWIKKLSSKERKLLFVDGFAGPGVYPKDASKGSPLIAMDIADKVISEYDVDLDSFECIFVEDNPTNYKRLSKSVSEHEKKVHDCIQTQCIDTEFEDWAKDFTDRYDTRNPPPSLVFIDPFGYSGIPLDVLTELFKVRENSFEFLLTLMTGEMARWEGAESHKKGISTALGTPNWTDQVPENASKEQKAELLADLYQYEFKRESGARFTYPFQMIEEKKRQTKYHLIHITNHIHGLKIMKETMYNTGAGEQYAYLGPDHVGYEDEQLSFAEFSDDDDVSQRIEEFASELHQTYNEQEIEFEELLKQTLDQNPFTVKHYRKAFEYLSNKDKLKVNGEKYTINDHTKCGEKSEIEFIDRTTLQDYI